MSDPPPFPSAAALPRWHGEVLPRAQRRGNWSGGRLGPRRARLLRGGWPPSGVGARAVRATLPDCTNRPGDPSGQVPPPNPLRRNAGAERKADVMTEPGLGSRGPGGERAADVRPERVEIDELLRAVARGDDAAFARLYDLLAPRVFGLARRVLRDPAQAEEMAQEVLVEVWRTAARFDPERGAGSRGCSRSPTAAPWTASGRSRRARTGCRRSRRRRRPTRPTTRLPTRWARGWNASRCAPLPRRPDRAAARGDHAGLLRRPHLPRGRGPCSTRPSPPSRPACGTA